jgi:hypothetical protein
MFVHLAIALLSQDRPEPDWLPVMETPKQLSHVLTIAPPTNPGPKLVIKGRVLKADQDDHILRHDNLPAQS